MTGALGYGAAAPAETVEKIGLPRVKRKSKKEADEVSARFKTRRREEPVKGTHRDV